MFVLSLFLGRAFCGWACPCAGIQEACFPVNDQRVHRNRWIKYIIWAPWICAITVMFILAGGIKGVKPMYMMKHFISIAVPQSYIIFYLFLALFVVLSLAVGRRSFCHHVCWMAPFLVLGDKTGRALRIPSLHLDACTEKCNGCGLCSKKCPMSLPVLVITPSILINSTPIPPLLSISVGGR